MSTNADEYLAGSIAAAKATYEIALKNYVAARDRGSSEEIHKCVGELDSSAKVYREARRRADGETPAQADEGR